MAKYDSSKKIDAIELHSNPDYLPAYAKNLTGRICTLVGVHYNSGGYPVFTTPDFRFEDGRYMYFHEGHIAQFIYESNIVLDIDVDCECEADSWKVGKHHNCDCPLYAE